MYQQQELAPPQLKLKTLNDIPYLSSAFGASSPVRSRGRQSRPETHPYLVPIRKLCIAQLFNSWR